MPKPALALLLCLAACGPSPVDDIDENAEDDMPTSIFRNVGRRTTLQPQSSAQNSIDVTTEDEFFQALTSLPRADGNCYGKAINIVKDISFSQEIVTSSLHSGLRITSSSRSRITSTVALDRLFLVASEDLSIDGLFFAAGLSATNIVEGTDSFDARNLAIVDNIVDENAAISALLFCDIGVGFGLTVRGNRTTRAAAHFLVYGPSGTGLGGQGSELFRGVITQNNGFGGGVVVAVMNSTVVSNNVRMSLVSVDGSTGSGGNNIISGNEFDGGTGIAAIDMVNDGNNVISGNLLGGGDINTVGAVGAGGNSIVGNVNVGTITATGTDAVTSNT